MKTKPKANGKTSRSKTKSASVDGAEYQRTLDALQESEAMFSATFHSTPTALILARISDRRIEMVNKSFLELVGYQREEVIGQNPAEISPFPNPEQIEQIRKLLAETKHLRNFETDLRTKSGEIKTVLYSVDIIQLNHMPYTLSTMIDITQRKQVEQQIVRMKRLYATLSQVNQTIVRVKDRDELFRSICDVAVQFGEFSLAWAGLLDEDLGEIRPVAVKGTEETQWTLPIINIYEGELKNGLIAEAVRTSKVMTSEDVRADKRLKNLYDYFHKYAYHSSAAIPIRLKNKTIGVISLSSAETGLFQDEQEVHLLKEMGLDISFALDTMETERSKRQWADAFEHCAHGIVIGDPKTNRIQTCNLAFAQDEGGTTIQDFVSMPFLDMYAAQDHEAIRQFIAEADRTGSVRFEANKLRKDGSMIQVQMDIVSVRDESGNLLYRVATQQNITERKKAEQQLRQSEENFSKAFLSSPAALMITRFADGKYLELNEAYTKTIGYDRTELIGHLTTEFNIYVYPEQRNEIVNQMRAAGALYNYEVTIRNKSGELRTVLASLERIQFNGEDSLLSTFVDITERKRAEEEVQRQNQRLKVLREIDTAILASDSSENIVNAALDHIRELVDCERANLALIEWEKNEAVNFAVRDSKESAISNGARVSLDLIQDILEILSRNQPVIIDDLTTMPDPPPQIKIFIKEGLRSRCILPLFSQGNLIGSLTLSSKISGYFDEEKISLGREVANQVAIAISQSRLIENLHVLNTELEGRVAERTAELSQVNLELQHSNHAKDEFLATMSHELRTPLNSILGLSESLLEQRRDPLTERQQQSLQIVESSGRHLLELINDVLDLSKIEAGKFDYYPQAVNVDILCRSSVAFVKEQALRKSISLNYQNEGEIGNVYVDPRRVKQMLVNLLTNAVKFTPSHGQVTLDVKADADDDIVRFSVIDDGIGISPDDLKRLFEPFVQVDSALNRHFQGTGLGLALVQKMTDLHGGSVYVESETGKGSRFTVSLPWGRNIVVQQELVETGGTLVSTKGSTLSAEGSSSTSLVLLAEDNMANILTIGEYLESHGYKVAVAHDGVETLQMAEEINPDIILMDIQMPVMDGLEATRRLRKDTRFDLTPIIALTALAMSGDRERCLEVGANEYMSKPVSMKGLVKTINILLQNKNA
jgi:PAS domain S-box-containing protein